MSTSARRVSAPTLEMAMGHPSGAVARARHDETIGRLEALRSTQDIPGLGTRMTVAAAVAIGLWTTWWKQRFHIARRVRSVGRDVERTNARDLLTGEWLPLTIGNR